MPNLEKGQHCPLNVTQEASHRVMVGLGWDPLEGQGFVSKIVDRVKGKDLHHDLDVSCLIYDGEYVLLENISATDGVHANQNRSIYHSGDNPEGLGDGDDEEISAELKNIPEDVIHLVFYASIKTKQGFDEILNPEIRLVDGYSGHEFLKTALDNNETPSSNCYLFAHIYRKGESWFIHYLDQYLNKTETPQIEELVKDLISEKA